VAEATPDETPFPIWIDSNTPGAIRVGTETTPPSQVNYALNGKLPDGSMTTIPSRDPLSMESIAALSNAGIKTVTVISKPFELVCEELCGANHFAMKGKLWMVTPEQYKAFNEKPPVRGSTTSQPPVAGATTKPSVASATGIQK
jgi:hypothetical protein